MRDKKNIFSSISDLTRRRSVPKSASQPDPTKWKYSTFFWKKKNNFDSAKKLLLRWNTKESLTRTSPKRLIFSSNLIYFLNQVQLLTLIWSIVVRVVCSMKRHCNFFKWANSGHFLFIFVLFKHKLYRNNCWLQRDSNSDCQSKRRARWPHDHHHVPRHCNLLLKFYNSKVVNYCWLVRNKNTFICYSYVKLV